MVYEYRIAADNRLVWVGDAWLGFARDNGAPELTREGVVGRSLFSFISGAETEYLYYLLLDEVRTRRQAVTVPFRCDGPALRRFMRLTISPLEDDGVRFESTLVRQQPRRTLAFLDAETRRTAAALTICGWCKRVEIGQRWLDLERAVAMLDLFRSPALPQQNQGVCADCGRRLRRTVLAAAG